MRNTTKRIETKTAGGDRSARTPADIRADIERRFEDQKRDLGLLCESHEAETDAKTAENEALRAENEKMAARFGDTSGKLAETEAALESANKVLKRAEAKAGRLEAKLATVRAALDADVDGDPERLEDGPGGEGADAAAADPQAMGDPAENPILFLSDVERDALDALAAKAGFVDRAALICDLCRRAIADVRASSLADDGRDEPTLEPVVT